MPFDGNKLYASEILAILLQNHEGEFDAWTFCVSTLYQKCMKYMIHFRLYAYK